jgi:hypothetical protein
MHEQLALMLVPYACGDDGLNDSEHVVVARLTVRVLETVAGAV